MTEPLSCGILEVREITHLTLAYCFIGSTQAIAFIIIIIRIDLARPKREAFAMEDLDPLLSFCLFYNNFKRSQPLTEPCFYWPVSDFM